MNSALNVAIVDFGLGNLYSVKHACAHAGMNGIITDNADVLYESDAIFLPGVGAFRDAMNALHEKNLVEPLRDLAGTKPLIGICLGLQLLMSSSEEFGASKGLDIIPGRTLFLGEPRENGKTLKVPHVGWNKVRPARQGAWKGTPLSGLPANEPMYFVHSYYVVPDDENTALCLADYGDITFCSAVAAGNVIAFQFHPEKSGRHGLEIYENIAGFISKKIR
mgnify:CR=1 FL=1